MSQADDEGLTAARIPADIEREDQVLGPLTARQAAILAVAALVLWLGYVAGRSWISPLAYVALVAPVAVVVAAVVLGRRDGVSMDRFLLAAVAFRRMPKRQVHAPEGVPALPAVLPPSWASAAGAPPVPLVLPCREVSDGGVLDLGREGQAALAVCGTVNFDLRTGAEQQALTGSFARWLNSLTGPVQILVRAHRLDVDPLVTALSASAGSLPHPALEQAALAHAGFLHALAGKRDLLTRQVLLVAREPAMPGPGRSGGAGPRARQRLAEAARALGAAEIPVTALDGAGVVRAITATDAAGATRSPTVGGAR
ncbi:PrgI family protein [Actinacidiphila sp. bgisy167]|uniref:PrgI family protein n=1 Tax=Actinacidiphila sp. bgisy167 TaxID=3413797 RepID=UPI003D7033CD